MSKETYKHHLAISGETSTYTEADNLVDIDYFSSERSFEWSNDEDDENSEDLRSENYLQNLLYTIDRIVFDESYFQDKHTTMVPQFEIPKNLLAECHVWKQKFKYKRIDSSKKILLKPIRGLKTRSPVIQTLNQTNPNTFSASDLTKQITEKGRKLSLAVNMNPQAKIPHTKLTSGMWDQSPVYTSQNRVTLPPIINHKRFEANSQHSSNNRTGTMRIQTALNTTSDKTLHLDASQVPSFNKTSLNHNLLNPSSLDTNIPQRFIYSERGNSSKWNVINIYPWTRLPSIESRQ